MNNDLRPINTLPNFKRFCMTIGELPTSYLETMTYYEMLVWFTEYMKNTIIPTINNNGLAVQELQDKYIELKNFVDNYFDNLDVQEEINNKLDQMVTDGTLPEIIASYLNSKAVFGFDSVESMKNSTNLINGSYAETLGYHTKNDGGNALYKIRNITNDDVVDNMFIIPLNNENLIAELIVDENVNVMQLGAYGNDNNDDTLIFNKAYEFCFKNNKIMYIPKNTYKVSNINLKSINIKCNGYINNSEKLIVGALSNGSTTTDINIYKCNDIEIQGAKNCKINIQYCNDLILYADGNDNNNTSIAYNKINGIKYNSITLNGINNGWINENEFNVKRCMNFIKITGDGTYQHNNNHFNNICLEGETKYIQIDYGHHNYITYRGEGQPQLILNKNPNLCFANTIENQYASIPMTTFNSIDFNIVDSFNFIQHQYLPSYKCIRLLELNKYNVKNYDSNIFINDNGEITTSWNNEYLSEKLEANYPFVIYLKSDKKNHRLYFTCYDENNNKIPGNVYIPGINYNTETKDYHSPLNQDAIVVTFIPSTEVKYVELKVTGGNSVFNKMSLDMLIPFTNTQTFINTIKSNGKHLNNIPSSITTNNPTWEVGDIIYKTTPDTILGWVCITSGTGASSVWKEIPLN